MGSFNATCCASGLPIGDGTPVRFFLLGKSTGGVRGQGLEITSEWFPRTFPLRAVYDDYGSVEKVETGIQQELWLEGLRYDVQEIGWGDNQYHDPPVSKGMSFDEMLTILRKGRLNAERVSDLSILHQLSREERIRGQMVRAGLPKEYVPQAAKPIAKVVEEQDKKVWEPENGVPTIQRVCHQIATSGLSLYTMQSDQHGYMVSEERPATVLVRWSGSNFDANHQERLNALLPVLSSSYACMVTVGSGDNDTEVVVRPKAGLKTKEGWPVRQYLPRPEKDPYIPIQMAMIREDVWQALIDLGRRVPVDYSTKAPAWKRAIRKAWARTKSQDEPYRGSDSFFGLAYKDDFWTGNPSHTSGALNGHWNLMAAKELSPADTEAFLDIVEEFDIVRHVLMMTRCRWFPAFFGGPQLGEYKLHKLVHEAFADIAHSEWKRRQ